MPTPFSFSLPLWTHIPSGTRGFLVSAFSSKWHAPGKVGCFMLSFYAAYGPTTAEWSLAACRTSSLAALLGARILSVVAQHPCRWWLPSGCFLLPAHDSQSYLPFTCPYFPLVMTPPDLDSSTPILVLMLEQFQMQRVAGPSRARRWAPFV